MAVQMQKHFVRTMKTLQGIAEVIHKPSPPQTAFHCAPPGPGEQEAGERQQWGGGAAELLPGASPASQRPAHISLSASYNQNILSLQIQGLEVLIKLIARPSPRKHALVSRRQIKSVCFPEALWNIPTDLWYKTPTETDHPNPKQFYSPLWLVFITSQYTAKSGPAAWNIQSLLIWLHLKWNPWTPDGSEEPPPEVTPQNVPIYLSAQA